MAIYGIPYHVLFKAIELAYHAFERADEVGWKTALGLDSLSSAPSMNTPSVVIEHHPAEKHEERTEPQKVRTAPLDVAQARRNLYDARTNLVKEVTRAAASGDPKAAELQRILSQSIQPSSGKQGVTPDSLTLPSLCSKCNDLFLADVITHRRLACPHCGASNDRVPAIEGAISRLEELHRLP